MIIVVLSFWGKFGQRTNLPQHQFIFDAETFFARLMDESITLSDFLLHDDFASVTFLKRDEFLEVGASSNIAIACFTTAHARLRLWGALNQLGERALYFDTVCMISSSSLLCPSMSLLYQDSVIFVSRPGMPEPPEGPNFGDFKVRESARVCVQWI